MRAVSMLLVSLLLVTTLAAAGADDEPPLLRLFLSGLAYRWDPAARMMPFSVKLVRRLLNGWEPTPIDPPSGSASAGWSGISRTDRATPAANRR